MELITRHIVVFSLFVYCLLYGDCLITDCQNEKELHETIQQCFSNVTFDLPAIRPEDFNGDFSSLIQLLNEDTCRDNIDEIIQSSVCVHNNLVPCSPEQHRYIFTAQSDISLGLRYTCNNIKDIHDSCITSQHLNISKCYFTVLPAIVPQSNSPTLDQIVHYLCQSQTLKHNCTLEHLQSCDNKDYFVCGLDYLLSDQCVDRQLNNCSSYVSNTTTSLSTNRNQLKLLTLPYTQSATTRKLPTTSQDRVSHSDFSTKLEVTSTTSSVINAGGGEDDSKYISSIVTSSSVDPDVTSSKNNMITTESKDEDSVMSSTLNGVDASSSRPEVDHSTFDGTIEKGIVASDEGMYSSSVGKESFTFKTLLISFLFFFILNG